MSSSSLLTQKDQIHCPYCYRKVKCRGGLASHIWQSLACQAKHDNDNPQLPGTSHDPILTPNHHDTPPGHHDTPLGRHDTPPGTGRCKRLNSELGAQTALHLSVSKGVIQRKRESRSSATSSSNDNSRPSPMAQGVHTGMKYVLFT